MSMTDRIDSIYRNISVTNRTRIVFGSVRDGRDPDDFLFRTVPAAQRTEFQRRVRLVLERTRELGTQVALLENFVTEFRLKVLLVRVLQACAAQRDVLKLCLSMIVPEPITDDDYQRLQEELRSSTAPLQSGALDAGGDGGCVEQPADRRPADLSSTRDLPQLVAMRRLLRAVDPAAMEPADEFDEAMDDALEHSSDPVPDAAAYFEIYPNSDAAHVATMRRLFEDLVSMATGHDASLPEVRVEALLAQFRWLWRDLRCIELADERLARKELGGDHPLGTEDRERVREMRASLLAARDVLQAADGPPVELTEPSELDVLSLADGLRFLNAVVVDTRGDRDRLRPQAAGLPNITSANDAGAGRGSDDSAPPSAVESTPRPPGTAQGRERGVR